MRLPFCMFIISIQLYNLVPQENDQFTNHQFSVVTVKDEQ